MASAATRTLLALFVTFFASRPGLTEKPLQPRNVKLRPVDRGLQVSWEPPVELDGRPVERYSIGYGKSMRSLRVIKVGKDRRSELLEDVEPGVLHFLKMSAENEEGMSKPVYRAETPGGPELVKLDGFAVVGGAAVNSSSPGPSQSPNTEFRSRATVQAAATRVDRTARPSDVSLSRAQRRPPQGSSGPGQPQRTGPGTPLLDRRSRHHVQPQADQRNRHSPKQESESVHVVSLQALKPQGRGSSSNRAAVAKKAPPEPEEYEPTDISVRVMSPQSVLISWVDPAVEMQKVTPGGSRSYTVKYREKGESARWEYKESAQRRLMIDTLSADGMYEFSVRISQGDNHGKWSVSVFQRTPESAPSGPPENFMVKPLRGKGTAVTATWDPPDEPNGRIREYILSYAPAMKPFGMKSLTYRGSTTTATVDGLTPGDRYIFKIRATNRRGQGPQSKVFSVAMPGTSSAASSSSKTEDSPRRTSHAHSKQDSYHDDTDHQSTEEPTTTTTTTTTTTSPPRTTQAPPTNRRTRPLTQTRSYHSILSSARGSVRNGAGRGRGRERQAEEEKTPTTPPPPPPPEEEEVDNEAVEEEKEPDNDVAPPDSEEAVGYNKEKEPSTPETPKLKAETPPPTTAAPKPPKRPVRGPIKIRVHQRPGAKASSSSPSSPSTSSSSSSSSLPIPSRTQESAAIRKDHSAATYPVGKDTYDRTSETHTKPSTPAPSQAVTQAQTDAPSVGRGSAVAGRNGGPRRRNPGILTRGNPSRVLNGFHKPGSASAGTSQSTLPTGSQNQATSNTHSSGTSQSRSYDPRTSHTQSSGTSQSLPGSGSQNQATSNTQSSATSQSLPGSGSQNQATSNTQSSRTSQSRSYDPRTSHAQSSGTSQSLPRSESQDPSTSDRSNSGTSQATSHRGSHTPTASRTHGAHTPAVQDTTYGEGNDGRGDTERDVTGDEEATSSSRATTSAAQEPPTEKARPEEAREEESLPPSRVSPSFAQRFPSLASRYPGRFGAGARAPSIRQDGRVPWSRTSSSVGAGRPILRGASTRVSGATGAAGVSALQETSDDLKKPSALDPLKNGVGSLNPSLPNRNTVVSGSRHPDTSSSSSSSPSSGHRDSNEPVHRGSDDDNDHNEEYLNERSKETHERNEKVAEPTPAPKTTGLTSNEPHRTLETNEDNESGDTRETSSRTRTGSSPVVPPYQRRPVLGPNGRVRSPLLANRQFGGSRFPLRAQPAQNTKLDSSSSSSSSSSPSSNLPQPVLTLDRAVSSGIGSSRTNGLSGGTSQSSSSSSSRDSLGGQGTRTRSPVRGKPINGGGVKPSNGNDKNGRPNLTTADDKDSSLSTDDSKASGRRYITGPGNAKWLVDLDRGVLMNEEGRILQDSDGRPRRVVLGEDGRTIFDHLGSPLLNEDGMALFGSGRDSRPVDNPKDKVLTVGGKPIVGLDRPRSRTTTTTAVTTTTTTRAPTTTTTTTTTPTTTEEPTTPQPYPTCPPGTYSKTDAYGFPELDPDGILDCYPDETVPPPTTATTTTPATTTTSTTSSTTTTTTAPPAPEPDTRAFNNTPVSEFDLTGKKRFTAPYVSFIQKDPGDPCSLTEALEYLQVDILAALMSKDSLAYNQKQPPKNKPHNVTVVAMEGCHSFVILDWARPLQDDMVSGYMVHSASYDDVLNNRWSASTSGGGTHLPLENLKPNSRYYFKVQAKNIFGLGPFSDTLTYFTESDDPLLIERPPDGEPIWIPYSFKYNHVHSVCKGSQYVKRTWYRKFVGVVLCNSLRYKIFMGDGLRETFYSIGDTFGQGEDHCQFVDSYLDGRTGPVYLSNTLPTAQGYRRSFRQEPVSFGTIGRRTPHPFVGWYECGVPIPGKW